MVFLVYREPAKKRKKNPSSTQPQQGEQPLEIIGVISDVDSLHAAREKFELYFSIPAVKESKYILLVESFRRVAYKKSHRHKINYFLREMAEVTQEMIRFPNKRMR